MNAPRFQRSLTWMAAGLGAACAAALGYYWFTWSARHISTDDAYVETELSPVSSRIMGYVREVFSDENDEVAAGAPLLKLDDADVNLELSYKGARLSKAGADVERARRLARDHAISSMDLEVAQAALTGAKADLEASLLKLKYTNVNSPVGGVVAKRSAQPGQFVQPGQSLFVVVPRDRVWIRANFKESQLRKIRVGQAVNIRVDAYPGEAWSGSVERILPSSVASLSLLPPENATGNFTKVVQRFPVRISVRPREGYQLRPGMSVVPTIAAE